MVPHPYVPFPKAINATFHYVQEGKWLPILVGKVYHTWKDHNKNRKDLIVTSSQDLKT
jgi:hypothetical protein